MLKLDPKQASLIALWNAKKTFSTLAILRNFFGNDLDLAKVAFTLALRTRPDFFTEPEENFLEIVGDPDYFIKTNLSASVYEISKFSGIDRTTTRRKLYKLIEFGFVEKTESGNWTLVNFLKDQQGTAAKTINELFKSNIIQTAELLNFLSEGEISNIGSKLTNDTNSTYNALSSTEVREKLKKEKDTNV